MKKYFLLIVILLFTSGCKAEYTLTYEDNKLSESLNVLSQKNSSYDGESFSSLVENAYKKNNYIVNYYVQPGDTPEEYWDKYTDVYNKKIINDNQYGLNLSYSYEEDINISNSYMINSLFENFAINDFVLKASNTKNIFITYPHLNELTISFKTDKKIKDTNCDKEKDNIYYWYINKENYKDKKIEISFDVLSEEKNILSKNGFLTDSAIKYIFLLLLVFLLIIVVHIYEKIKNSNK